MLTSLQNKISNNCPSLALNVRLVIYHHGATKSTGGVRFIWTSATSITRVELPRGIDDGVWTRIYGWVHVYVYAYAPHIASISHVPNIVRNRRTWRMAVGHGDSVKRHVSGWVGFNVSIDTLQVISETIYTYQCRAVRHKLPLSLFHTPADTDVSTHLHLHVCIMNS